MSLWFVAGGSVAAIAVGIAIAFGLDHLAWRLADEKRRRLSSRRRGLLDLRVRI